MTWLTNFLVTTVGRKQLMALTGLALGGFLLAHLSGNLLLFVGEDAFNAYAQWLGTLPFLPLARIGLITVFVVHIALALNLTQQNCNARPQAYFYKAPSDASVASRTMILSGLLVIIYLIIHLFNFTWSHADGPQGLYGLVVEKLTDPFYSLLYISSMVVLAIHLVHGIQSAFQTLGINHPKHTPIIKALCLLFAVGVCAGFAAIPAYLMLSQGGA